MADAAAAHQGTQHMLPPNERIRVYLRNLPTIAKDQVDIDDWCAICYMPFASIFDEVEQPTPSQVLQVGDNPITVKIGSEEMSLEGVTKIVECGHIFCRKDLTEWIKGFHGSCPACRHPFLNIHPPSDSDDESSDGGEYLPNSEDFEDEDNETVFTDGFSDDGPDTSESLRVQEEAEHEAEMEALQREFADPEAEHEAEMMEALQREFADPEAEHEAEIEALQREFADPEAEHEDEMEAPQQEFDNDPEAEHEAEIEALREGMDEYEHDNDNDSNDFAMDLDEDEDQDPDYVYDGPDLESDGDSEYMSSASERDFNMEELEAITKEGAGVIVSVHEEYENLKDGERNGYKGLCADVATVAEGATGCEGGLLVTSYST